MNVFRSVIGSLFNSWGCNEISLIFLYFVEILFHFAKVLYKTVLFEKT